jgi:two-component system sensor histidine kinase KdpD
VARGFTEAMGGALTAEQSYGGGLTMRLRLPLAAPRDDPRPRRRGRAGPARALAINLRARRYEVPVAATARPR